MAELCDIREASRKITDYLQSESGVVDRRENQWHRPVTEFGDCPQWTVNIKSSEYVGEIDFGRKEWARSREAVDVVLDLLLVAMRREAVCYEGLRIDSYIRQGSSRDGLKVIAPDEYDTILEFHIEGLETRVQQKPIFKPTSGGQRLVPGFCYMAVVGMTMGQLASRFPRLHREGVFQELDGGICISSRHLHTKVFESLIDKSCNKIKENIASYNRSMHEDAKFNIAITRQMNPPAINITIHLDDDSHKHFMKHGPAGNTSSLVKAIDVDIVPGFLLRYDNSTSYEGTVLGCPIHAVCKWSEGSFLALEFVDQSLIWDVKTTGYEKYILDIAKTSRRKLYILTALRIIKTYFTRTKKIAKDAGHPPPQLVTVLRSYHLKQITFYLLYYLCHKYSHFRVDDAQRATAYFIDCLRTSLQAKHLPHFFYSNKNVQNMLPGFPMQTVPCLRYDLYRKIPNEAIDRVLQSLKDHLVPNLGFHFVDSTDMEKDTVLDDFKSSIGGADFF